MQVYHPLGKVSVTSVCWRVCQKMLPAAVLDIFVAFVKEGGLKRKNWQPRWPRFVPHVGALLLPTF